MLSHLSTVPVHIEGGSPLLSVLSLSGGRAAHAQQGGSVVHSLDHGTGTDHAATECTLVTMTTGTGTGVISNGLKVYAAEGWKATRSEEEGLL